MTNQPKSISVSHLKTAVAAAVTAAQKQHPHVKPPPENEFSIYHWPPIFCGIPVPWEIIREGNEKELAFAAAIAKNLAANPALAGLGASGKTEPVVISQGGQSFVGINAGGGALSL